MKKSTIHMLAAVGAALATETGYAHAQSPQDATASGNAASRQDARPAPCSRPVYPPQALANKVEGTSTIGFLINADGYVIDSKLYKTSGDDALDEAARSGLAKCRFKPPTRDGKPVQAWVPVQYVWTMD